MSDKSIKNRVLKAEPIDWRTVQSLQPDTLKLPYNNKALKKSIIKHGFSNAYHVWQDPESKIIYWIDGHQRTDVFKELEAEGYEMPDKLMSVFYDLKDRDEAIDILLTVFNLRHNPISEPGMMDWLEVEKFNVTEIPLEVIHMEDKLVVTNFEYEKSNVDVGGDKDPEIHENQYDNDEDEGKDPNEPDTPNQPPERKNTTVPIFFNVEKIVNARFMKLKKQYGLDDSELFDKSLRFFDDNYNEEE